MVRWLVRLVGSRTTYSSTKAARRRASNAVVLRAGRGTRYRTGGLVGGHMAVVVGREACSAVGIEGAGLGIASPTGSREATGCRRIKRPPNRNAAIVVIMLASQCRTGEQSNSGECDNYRLHFTIPFMDDSYHDGNRVPLATSLPHHSRWER